MSSSSNAASRSNKSAKYLIVAVLVVAAFLGAYRFALAKTGGVPAAQGSAGAAVSPSAAGGGAGAACACCGSTQPTQGGLTGGKTEGRATVEGGVQKISVDVSQGYYQPNQIVLKAGVPAEITFGQASGCTAQVISKELGFAEDLSNGPRTVKLPALEKGEYPFYCGMQMVFGKVVVE
jgi:hypothetical protein